MSTEVSRMKVTERPKRRITIIGSGNVATHLAKAFYGAGNTIEQIWSRKYEHAELLAQQVMGEPTDKLELLRKGSDVYVLAVKDDALSEIAQNIRFKDSLVLHTSGTAGIEVLCPISQHVGVMWSPQTFVRDIAMDYSTLPFCIEGNSGIVEREICELLQPISDHVYTLDGEQRRWAHLASVIVNNFGNALNAIAQEQLRTHGIPFEILHPLIAMTAEKIKHSKNLWELQTGPAARKDKKTIDTQRRMITDQSELLKLYDLMTTLIEHATN